MRTKIKEKIYNVIAYSGMWVLHRLFPEYFGVEPIKPTDRFIEYPWALNLIHNHTRDALILDVGCAGSMFTMLIYSIGFRVWGIDVRNASSDLFSFVKGNICESPFDNNTFDVVTAISTVEHIGISEYARDYTDFSAINEIHRILKPDGLLIMSVPFADKYREETFHRVYDADRLKELFINFSSVHWDILKSPEGDYKLALIQVTK